MRHTYDYAVPFREDSADGSNFAKYALMQHDSSLRLRARIPYMVTDPNDMLMFDEEHMRVSLQAVAFYTVCRCLGWRKLTCFFVEKRLVDPDR